jgi:ATP-dependent helicase HrpA
VAAYERLSLYGFTLYPRRRINYGPIDPVESREIFIRHALVYGEYYSHSAFFKHNQQLIQDIEALEAKSRRRDILVDEEILYDFYEQHIPTGIYNGRAFEKWRKSYERNNPKALFLERDFLMQRNDDHVHVEHYPNHLSIGDVTLPLDYHFEPGQQKDGVTVKLPAMVVHQMQAAQFDYLVPGMLEEKITAIIKALPKQVRKQFIPAPDYAQACAEIIEPSERPLIEVVADTLFRMTGNRIPAEALENIQLPEHLQPRFEVVDEKNKLISAGRELEQLKKSIKKTTQKSFASLSNQSIERADITTWDFADLASTYQLEVAGLSVKSWPALEDKQDSVAIRLFDSQKKADQAHQKGLLRLFILQTASEIRPIKKALRDIQKLCLYYSSVGKCPELTQSVLANTLRLTFLDDQADIRTQAAFEQRLQRRGQLLVKSQELCHVLGSALRYNHEVRKALKGRIAPDLLDGLSDINVHLQQLVFVGFLDQVNLEQLRHYPRYLKGILLRLEKLKQNPAKDRQLRLEMQPLWLDYKKYSKGKISSVEFQGFRWQLEELRISLFAQQLGTSHPVSVPRLKKIWRETVL